MAFVNLAGSSNGRTTDFGSVYLGSSPSPAARIRLTLLHPYILKNVGM